MARMTTTPVNMMVLSTAPTAPAIRAGDLEYDSDAKTLRIWNGTAWVNIGQPVTESLPDQSVTSAKFSAGGTSDNLLRNPNFEDLATTGGFPLSWTLDPANNGTGTFGVLTAGATITGSNTLALRASASLQQRVYQDVIVAPFDSFELSAMTRVASGATITAGFGLFVAWMSAIGTVVANSTVYTYNVTTTAARARTPVLTSPAGSRYARVIVLATTAASGRDVEVDSVSFSRHSLTYGAPGTSLPGDVASEGTSTALARADHKHARETTALKRAFTMTMMGA